MRAGAAWGHEVFIRPVQRHSASDWVQSWACAFLISACFSESQQPVSIFLSVCRLRKKKQTQINKNNVHVAEILQTYTGIYI